ncbi:MAG TPA: TerC family protein [bacterium]|nr:TerC family protein [bacterium]HPN43503.1 TerC family protein [bacterium]
MWLLWIGFIIIILLLLFLDLGVFNRRVHVIKAKEALLWTLFWIVLALLFDIFIYYAYKGNWFGIGLGEDHIKSGADAALKYFTGYIIEKSLSMDNIFVIAMIFSYFKIPAMYQHRVLFWGILGALILRGIMIIAGTALIHKFSWMIFVFGAFLIVTAIKMLITRHDTIEPEKNILIRAAKKIYPVTSELHGAKFFIRDGHKHSMTPLFLVLLIIESTDVLFAVDSIPAIFAVTTDPFIVFTSNVFAILGLRSLYFALAAMMEQFRYLKISLVFILAYVGVKMIFSHSYPIPTLVSLSIIAVILFVGVAASIMVGKLEKEGKHNRKKKPDIE